MISDNHNAYNNYNNYIDEYELTNGYAVVDRNFSIVTANEPMYLFLGMSKHYSIMDAIHQVDIDDFIDVANSLICCDAMHPEQLDAGLPPKREKLLRILRIAVPPV